jgi:hypothetical protein
MATEIERRFLVRDPRAVLTVSMTRWQRIRQGYFGRVEGLRVRVRIVTKGAGKLSAVLTLKGPCQRPGDYRAWPFCAVPGGRALWAHRSSTRKRQFLAARRVTAHASELFADGTVHWIVDPF